LAEQVESILPVTALQIIDLAHDLPVNPPLPFWPKPAACFADQALAKALLSLKER
jgi:hypothetical protein